MKTELLAPAGDIEAAYAALFFGADAIYLGLKSFSARATATNFDAEQLGEITAYAHHLKRKVYVTVNTLVTQNELPDLIQNLDICRQSKVDAVILQDLGVAYLIKTQYPELEMHASTQMAVHNIEGALFLKKLGFSRVVLARELSLREINNIAAIEGLETEVFIHGALCYSYSGICQFSALEYAKSANRGKCLYPCRAIFDADKESKHFFSMKDMALEGDILKIRATSLKIEGRKKSALYVAAVTDFYRRILDGQKPDETKAENIKQIFSRPWCKFHFAGKNKNVVDKDFVGHRGLEIGKIENIVKGRLIFTPTHDIGRFDGLQIDVWDKEKPFGFSVQKMLIAGKSVLTAKKGKTVEIELPKGYPLLKKGMVVYLASSSAVKGAYDYKKPKPKEFQNKIDISVKAEVFKDKIHATSEGFSFEVEGHFEPAIDANKVDEAFLKSFQKTGDTIFRLKDFELKNPQKCFVPASVINDLRRGLYEKIKPDTKSGHISILPQSLQNKTPQWIIKTDCLQNLEMLDLGRFSEIICLIDHNVDKKELSKFDKDKLRLSLPVVCRNPEIFAQTIQNLIDNGYHKWEVSNYWALNLIDASKYDVTFSPMIYTLNTEAFLMAQKIGAKRVSFALEDTLENIKNLIDVSPLETSLVIYQDAALFTSAVCIRNNDCAHCTGQKKWLELKKDGHLFKALSVPCETMLFDKSPFCIASNAHALKPTFYQMDFCHFEYTPQKVSQISDKLMKFEDILPCIKANFLKSAI